MRTLLYVPVVHTIYESVPLAVRRRLLRTDPNFRRDVAAINRLINTCWKRVRDDIAPVINALPVSRPRLWVWQDGLLINLCPRTRARFPPQRYPNHAALVWLHRQGARICATEHSGLVMLQYESMLLQMELPQGDRQAETVNREILAVRDDYVARLIMEGLGKNQTGILFMGTDHRVDRVLRKIDPAMRIIRITHFKDVSRQIERILTTPQKPRR